METGPGRVSVLCIYSVPSSCLILGRNFLKTFFFLLENV